MAAACILLFFSCSKDSQPSGGGGTNPPSQEEEPPATDEVSDNESTEYYQYGVAKLIVNTDGRVAVDSKEDYRACTINVNGNGHFSDRTGLRGKIRGRGNSTWFWYQKKPYRIKLDESSKMLGMKKNKDWVLLADFRDVTHMMNNVAFTMAHELGLPCANRSRYVQLVLNGVSKGLYMLTEQIEEGKHRVELDAGTGILLALDLNDGPGESPDATDNFWSERFGMACAVKYPKDVTASQKASVRTAFGTLEKAIDEKNWTEIQKLLDVESMIDYILIQELVGNGEVDNNPSMRSGYIHRYSSSSKWVMGPIWDADAGFGYDGADMFNIHGRCHTYFIHNRVLVFGTNPYYHVGAMNATAGDFFCRLFGIPEFVRRLKSRWAEVRQPLLAAVLLQIDKTEAEIVSSAKYDTEIWNINFSHTDEVASLKAYLTDRFAYLNTVIPNYPE